MCRPQFTEPYVLSKHAERRVFERTPLSGGHLLSYLQGDSCVWLPVRGYSGEWYALMYSSAADSYFVAVVALEKPVLKTVLTLALWEGRLGALPPVWLALARTVAAQTAASPASTAPDGAPAAVPDQDICFEVLLRNHPRYTLNPGAKPLTLGRLALADLIGLQVPGCDQQFSSARKAARKVPAMLGSEQFVGWLLAALRGHEDALTDNCELLVRVTRYGTCHVVDATPEFLRRMSPPAPASECAASPDPAFE